MKNVLNLFRDRRHEWRWTAVAGENGKILADSGEGYESEDNAIAGFIRVASMAQGPVEVNNAVTGRKELFDFGTTAFMQLKAYFMAWGIGFSEYNTSTSQVLVLEEGPSAWVLKFDPEGNYLSSHPANALD